MCLAADLSRCLDTRLKPLISYLVACRPLSIGMGNAIRSPVLPPLAFRSDGGGNLSLSMLASCGRLLGMACKCTLRCALRAAGCARWVGGGCSSASGVTPVTMADGRGRADSCLTGRWLKSKIAHLPSNLRCAPSLALPPLAPPLGPHPSPHTNLAPAPEANARSKVCRLLD